MAVRAGLGHRADYVIVGVGMRIDLQWLGFAWGRFGVDFEVMLKIQGLGFEGGGGGGQGRQGRFGVDFVRFGVIFGKLTGGGGGRVREL